MDLAKPGRKCSGKGLENFEPFKPGGEGSRVFPDGVLFGRWIGVKPFARGTAGQLLFPPDERAFRVDVQDGSRVGKLRVKFQQLKQAAREGRVREPVGCRTDERNSGLAKPLRQQGGVGLGGGVEDTYAVARSACCQLFDDEPDHGADFVVGV